MNKRRTKSPARNLREGCGKTAEEVAGYLGVSCKYLIGLEETNGFPFKLARKLATYYKAPLDVFLKANY